MLELAIALGGTALAIVGFVLYVRLCGPRFIEAHGTSVVAEPPSRVMGRLTWAVGAFADYTYRKIGSDRLEIIHSSAESDDDARSPAPELANAVLDLLVVTAESVATSTEITLRGRAEPKLIDALRRALAEAPAPATSRPASPRRTS